MRRTHSPRVARRRDRSPRSRSRAPRSHRSRRSSSSRARRRRQPVAAVDAHRRRRAERRRPDRHGVDLHPDRLPGRHDRAAGTKLGDVTATAAAADLGGAVLPLTGELDAIAPTRHGHCRRAVPGRPPSQTWNLQLTAAGPDARHPAVRRCGDRGRGRRGLPDEARRLPAPAGRARRHAGPRAVRCQAPLGDLLGLRDHAADGGRRLPLDVALDAVQPRQGHGRTPRGSRRDAGDSPHPDAGQAHRHEEEGDDDACASASRARPQGQAGVRTLVRSARR